MSSRLLPREQVTAEDIRTYQMSEIAAFKDSVAAALGGAGLAYSVVMGGGPFLDTSPSLPGTVRHSPSHPPPRPLGPFMSALALQERDRAVVARSSEIERERLERGVCVCVCVMR